MALLNNTGKIRVGSLFNVIVVFIDSVKIKFAGIRLMSLQKRNRDHSFPWSWILL